ncbi:MAG: hypothetical protein JWN35_2066 [Frankiales bacterium]|jgi:hypothetical protein|nr:hypothetical protein [Frankiales bacterium]
MSRMTSRTAVLGVALVAAAGTATPALAAPARATTLSLTVARTSVAHNQRDPITGTLDAGRTPLRGKRVLLEKKASGARSFTQAGSATTDSRGQVHFSPVVGTRRGERVQYELVFPGDSGDRASRSRVVTVSVT